MDVLRRRAGDPPALLRAAAAACLLMASAGVASAQQAAAPARGNFILGVAGGYAATKTDCSNCGSTGDESPDADGATYDNVAFLSLSAAWRLNTKAVAGAEVQVETAREDARVLYLMGSVRFHPWASQGFFVKAGFGIVQVMSNVAAPDGSSARGTYRGVGFYYGIGWELLKGKPISFAPNGAHYVSTLASVTTGEFTGVNVIGNVWVAGIQVFFN
jgi:hypothetical protein